MEEQWLVERAKKGDSESFGKLYDKYVDQIYRFTFLKTSSKEDSEDLTNQVFMKAWESIGSFDFRGFPFGSWLYRIAHNTVIDYYRTKKSTVDIESISEEHLSESHGTEKKIDSDIRMESVKAALTKLKTDEQNIVIMKFVNDLSNKEISEITGKSEGAIRVIQHRALKQLKKHIEET